MKADDQGVRERFLNEEEHQLWSVLEGEWRERDEVWGLGDFLGRFVNNLSRRIKDVREELDTLWNILENMQAIGEAASIERDTSRIRLYACRYLLEKLVATEYEDSLRSWKSVARSCITDEEAEVTQDVRQTIQEEWGSIGELKSAFHCLSPVEADLVLDEAESGDTGYSEVSIERGYCMTGRELERAVNRALTRGDLFSGDPDDHARS